MKLTLTIDQSGVAIVAPRQKAEIDAILQRSREKHGGYITVTIETPRRPRTTGELSQNRALNGYIQQICKETGNDFGVVKSEVKYRALKRGYPILTRNGKPVLDIYGREMGISEADSSVEECGYLIEEVIQLASELGIRLEGLE